MANQNYQSIADYNQHFYQKTFVPVAALYIQSKYINLIKNNQIIMSSPDDDSLEVFLINECHLQEDCVSAPFFKQMGLKSKKQVLTYLSDLSLSDLTKLGLPEEETTAIMNYSNFSKITKNRIFPRLANKYVTLNIIGYAFVQPEAVDLGYLCNGFRHILIRNYQLFKQTVIKAEKKEIRSVIQLLDQRWLSKRYRLCYIKRGDNMQDVADCLALLGDRLHFHSIEICFSFYSVFCKFRPIILKLEQFHDIPQLFELIPHSVAKLSLIECSLSLEGDCGRIRKFRKLKVLDCKNNLKILSRLATDSLTIDDNCLNEPGVIKYLSQMDCKQITVQSSKLEGKQLIEFFGCQSKASKFIDCSSIKYSQIEQVEWACKYFTKKCLNKHIEININSNIKDAELCFKALFKGSLKLFQNKRIIQHRDISINCNVCVTDGDTHTQSLQSNSFDLVVLALNNCTSLTMLKIRQAKNCEYQKLQVERLQLQELIINDLHDSSIPLISDILNKSKDTLSLLSCDGKVDLSPLWNSTILRKLIIDANMNDANLFVIQTFSNLEELQTGDNGTLAKFNNCQRLKTLRWNQSINKIDDLPLSVTTLISLEVNTFDQVKQLIEKNSQVKKLEIKVSNIAAAQLLDKFKNAEIIFDLNRSLFSFRQLYTYLHPECKQIGIPASEPNHVLYELLFSRIHDKMKVLLPFLRAAQQPNSFNDIIDAPPEMIEYLATFNGFKNSLKYLSKLGSVYFEYVFNEHMSVIDDEYMRIIVSAYDEVFHLQTDIDKTVAMLRGISDKDRKLLKREQFFQHCRNNWMEPLSSEDFDYDQLGSVFDDEY
ncbi:hypothetical protein FGO68_gene7554 [Halteria grandinella]|uniref:Uncharacterized protein n=1 Tax=Halteria grandinella TaxID=5974 RepID=A0A8J8T6A1_HALGN|nr:hypothetical protein FGO68_gene7554 [Halteria grandinella]